MTNTAKQRKRNTFDLALRGAAAGVVGGALVTLAEREVLTRIVGTAKHRAGWDDVSGRGLRRVGVKVTGGRKIAAGVVGQLALAGALGACYAVLREETKDSRAGVILIDAALAYAASYLFPDMPAPSRRRRRMALRQKIVRPVNPAATFDRLTAMALGVMLR